jgi:Tfp pilus assembly protein PilF
MTHLERAVTLNPDYRAAHNNLGLVLAGQGRLDEAETHFQLAECSRAETLNNLAFARFLDADLDAASTMYGKVLQIDPDHAQARKSLESLTRIAGRASGPPEMPQAAGPDVSWNDSRSF